MASLTTVQKRLIKIASLLGAVQGAIYVGLAIICVIEIYSKNETYQPFNITRKDSFYYIAYFWFFHNYNNEVQNGIITPSSFGIFVWIYLVFNTVWVILSMTLMLTWRPNSQNSIATIRLWGTMTTIICLVDLVFIILLGIDYADNCVPYFVNTLGFEEEKAQLSCTNTMIPVIVIVGKGFILWCLNLVFVYILHRITGTLLKEEVKLKKFIMGQNIPRATLQRTTLPRTPAVKSDLRYESWMDHHSDFYSSTNNQGPIFGKEL